MLAAKDRFSQLVPAVQLAFLEIQSSIYMYRSQYKRAENALELMVKLLESDLGSISKQKTGLISGEQQAEFKNKTKKLLNGLQLLYQSKRHLQMNVNWKKLEEERLENLSKMCFNSGIAEMSVEDRKLLIAVM